jgi:hypothetical protein
MRSARVMRILSVKAVGLAAALASLVASTARAQSHFMPTVSPASENAPGWILTPALVYSGNWDDNVLLQVNGVRTRPDFVSIVNPQAHITYNGRRGQIDGTYDGAFLLYRDLNTLDSYDQRSALSMRRLVTKHVALFLNNSFASVPTTELVGLVAVPFVQTGSKLDELRAGVDAALGPRTTVVATYAFDWVQFAGTPEFASYLLGGHGHRGLASVRQQMSSRTTVTADYEVQHGIIAAGAQTFDIQTATAGIEERLSQRLQAFGAAGLAYLNMMSPDSVTRTGPVYRAGLTGQIRRGTVTVAYSRSFVPTFSFGGTTTNQDLTARLTVPLARKLTAQSSLAWDRNDPILPHDPIIHSAWIEATITYALQPWMQVAAFYGKAQQTIQPTGQLDHNRIGFQIITSKPLRVHR